MDTKLAKNYTIIFLLILNILLFFLSFLLEEKYKITKEQEKTIIAYLEKENIKIYADIPKKYEPMPQISMKKTKHDDLALQNIFFKNNIDLIRTEKFEDTIFKQGEKTLRINNLFIYFQDLEIKENFKYNRENSLNIAESYMKPLEQIYGKMYLDRVIEEEDYFFISYIQKIENYKIFNNVLNVKIYKDGKIKIYFNNYQKTDIISEKINICSVDEALYTFSKEIKNLIPDSEIYIRDIDLGYYLKMDNENITFSFYPYYRFYIKGNEMPFYVNAYTNSFEYETTIINAEEIFY
nr:two-component system regulatory protein YycI [uncultured Tyzzerella sp.]